MKIATQHYQDSVITPYGNNHWNGKEKIDISKEKDDAVILEISAKGKRAIQLKEKNEFEQDIVQVDKSADDLPAYSGMYDVDKTISSSLENCSKEEQGFVYDIIRENFLIGNGSSMSEEERQANISLGMKKAEYAANNFISEDKKSSFLDAMESIAKLASAGTAPVVRLIFELATKGMKYTEIANYLNDNGYDSIFEHYQKLGVRRCYERDIGQHMWSPSTVMGILYNEVYIGSVINNKTADNIDTGHQVVQRDKEDWIIVENCHEPLVSVEDFKLAHKMIARREKSPRKPNGKWRKSYLRCGVCGKGLNKYGNGSSYRCREGHVSRIRGEEIEQAVLDVARKMAVVRLEEFEIQMNKDSSSDDIGQEIESLKKAKAHYAKLKFEIYDDYTRTNITREQMAKKTAEVKNKIAELDKMIAEKQELFDLQKDLFVDAKQEQLTKLSKLDKFDEDVIRNIIDYVLIYDNEHIEIKWNFDDFHIE